MPITVNQEMIDTVAGDDRWDENTITWSANVDPGNFLQDIIDAVAPALPSPPARVIMSAQDVAYVREAAALWDDLIPESIVEHAGDEDADITVNQITNLAATSAG